MIDENQTFLQTAFHISAEALEQIEKSEQACQDIFRAMDQIGQYNQAKVLKAFQDEKIAARHFAGTTGYGYDDIGRDALDRVFARILGCEDALVRGQIASGTHAIALALFGLLLPGDELLSVTGKPYDTLEESIGIRGDAWGSLADYQVRYRQIELDAQGHMDLPEIEKTISSNTKIVYIQRSRGYSWRDSFSIRDIEKVVQIVKRNYPQVLVVVDNCYGEFTDRQEPTDVGADVIVGSLIKNPGGGLAPSGGYIAGKTACIEKIANRLTSPGIGREVGSYAAGYTSFFQGVFLAPHTTVQAMKGAALAAHVYEQAGFTVLPRFDAKRNDIIQAIRFETKEHLIAFCQAIQAASPVEGYVQPEPWDMPGYDAQVIMAAGTFVQGASIELSADAPIQAPYIAYMQGGLTYEHIRLAILMTLRGITR